MVLELSNKFFLYISHFADLVFSIPCLTFSEDILNDDILMGKNSSEISRNQGGPKTWTQDDMDMALDALRNHNMSLTKVR